MPKFKARLPAPRPPVEERPLSDQQAGSSLGYGIPIAAVDLALQRCLSGEAIR